MQLTSYAAQAADSDSRADISDALDDAQESEPSSPSPVSSESGRQDSTFMTPAAMVAEDDSDGGDVAHGMTSDDDDSSFSGNAFFCINCTGRLFGSDFCEDCGHCTRHDEQLFDPRPCPSNSMGGIYSGRSAALGFSASMHLSTSSPASLALCFDERMALHEEGRLFPHPERPDRIRAVIARIRASGLADRCMTVPCREATLEEVVACHRAELYGYLEAHCKGLTSLPVGAPSPITSDSYVNRHTFLCARLAAGGAAEVATRVLRGQALAGAAIIRPPGHHAESNMHMGFCFFNNAAVAARAAQAAGARRVLIFDFDVHHGNGTQHIFDDDPSVLYISIHRHDHGSFYPGTGSCEEVGHAAGEGFNVNIAWNHDEVSNSDYMAAFHQIVLPVSTQFAPDLIILSAGFDACEGDPIGGCRLTPECFAHMTAPLRSIAPVVALLEGGYNLAQTALATEATLRAMLGEALPPLPGPRIGPCLAAVRSIHAALRVQSHYWKCLQRAVDALPVAPYGFVRVTAECEWSEGDGEGDAGATGETAALVDRPLPPTRQEMQRAAMQRASGGARDVTNSVVACAASVGAGSSGAVAVSDLGAHVLQAGVGGGLLSALGYSGRWRGAHKRRLLAAIHRRALQSFWKRRRVGSGRVSLARVPL